MWAGKMNVEALAGITLNVTAMPVTPVTFAGGEIGAAYRLGFLTEA
jgi:hypothetical protein